MSSVVVNVDTTGRAMVTVGLPGVSTNRVEWAYWYLFLRGGISGICLATMIRQLQQYCK